MATINEKRVVVELYFNDLNEEAQEVMLEVSGIKHPREMSWDFFPIAFAAITKRNDNDEDSHFNYENLVNVRDIVAPDEVNHDWYKRFNCDNDDDDKNDLLNGDLEDQFERLIKEGDRKDGRKG